MDALQTSSISSARHLHPLSIAFAIAGLVRNNIIPTVAAVLSVRSGGWIGYYIAIAIFVVGLSIALIRYFTFRYRVTDEDLVINRGLFDRLHRTIPLHRIHNIDLSQNVFHRIFKVCEVRVETGSGTEPEAVMRVLSLVEFQRLKGEVLAARDRVHVSSSVPEDASQRLVLDGERSLSEQPLVALSSEDQPQLLLALPLKIIILAGVISSRGEAIAGLAFGFFWQWRFGDQWIPGVDYNQSTREGTREAIRAFATSGDYFANTVYAVQRYAGSVASVLVMMLGIALLFALLRLFSAIWFVLKFYGYRLELHHDLLHVRCGLFTQVSATVPRGRIQLISVQRSWFARKIGLASIRIETAGGNRKGEDMATSVGRRWFVPVLLDRDVERILGVLDQRVVFDEAALNWQPLARDATKRMRRPFIAASIVLFVVGLYLQPYWGWCVGLVVAIMGNWYVKKKSKSRRYARTDWGVVFRSGTWIQKCSMTFFEKIQSARLDQTPLDRRWGMQTLRLDTASAGPADHSICISLLDSEHANAEFKNLQNAIAMHSKYGH